MHSGTKRVEQCLHWEHHMCGNLDLWDVSQVFRAETSTWIEQLITSCIKSHVIQYIVGQVGRHFCLVKQPWQKIALQEVWKLLPLLWTAGCACGKGLQFFSDLGHPHTDKGGSLLVHLFRDTSLYGQNTGSFVGISAKELRYPEQRKSRDNQWRALQGAAHAE